MNVSVAPTTPPTAHDVLLDLVGPGPARTAVVKALRPDVADRTRQAWAALYERPQALPTAWLHGLAADVAAWQGAADLARSHAERARGAGDLALDTRESADPDASAVDPEASAALRGFAALVTVAPALVTPDDHARLSAAGVTPAETVLVAQLVAFETYLARLVDGLLVVAGAEPACGPVTETDVASGRRPRTGPTVGGRTRPPAFTRDPLDWEPWVPTPGPDELTDAQRESFAAKAAVDSVYFRLLSLTPDLTRARSALDNAIFLPREGGLPKAERELAAATSSRVNDCVYCASVHARKAAALAKRPDDVDRLLAVPLEREGAWQPVSVAPLADGQDGRWARIVDSAAALALRCPRWSTAQADALRADGVDDAGLADLVAATAFFAWANRLMLTLGEPSLPQPA